MVRLINVNLLQVDHPSAERFTSPPSSTPEFIKHCCQATLTAQWTHKLPIIQRVAPATLAAALIQRALSEIKDIDMEAYTVIDFCSGAGGKPKSLPPLTPPLDLTLAHPRSHPSNRKNNQPLPRLPAPPSNPLQGLRPAPPYRRLDGDIQPLCEPVLHPTTRRRDPATSSRTLSDLAKMPAPCLGDKDVPPLLPRVPPFRRRRGAKGDAGLTGQQRRLRDCGAAGPLAGDGVAHAGRVCVDLAHGVAVVPREVGASFLHLLGACFAVCAALGWGG